jgi:hypothetical protein
MEVGRIPYLWPEETDFAPWELDVIDQMPLLWAHDARL